MQNGIYQRSIGMAVEILGGHKALAEYLGVETEEIFRWLRGEAEPAAPLLARLVELIEKTTVAAAGTTTAVRSRRDEQS